MDLSRKPEVAGLIGAEIAKANASLPDIQQVKRYLLLTKELEADDAEMTRTRKVRRRFVAEKYASVIDAFYGGKESADVTVEITFEDGRKSVLNSTIAIHGKAAAEPVRRARSARLEGWAADAELVPTLRDGPAGLIRVRSSLKAGRKGSGDVGRPRVSAVAGAERRFDRADVLADRTGIRAGLQGD
jgi:hypothetical protein